MMVINDLGLSSRPLWKLPYALRGAWLLERWCNSRDRRAVYMVQVTERVEERCEAQGVPFDKLLGEGIERKSACSVVVLLILESLLTLILVMLGVIPA